MFFFRLLKILRIARHFRLDTLLWPTSRARFLLALLRPLLPQSPLSIPRAIRLRLALEALGPLFVKFGQILSTRRDLLPEDLATELAKLQDQVPPFPGQQAIHIIEKAQGQPIQALFSSFQIEALASASVAQVHLATLHDGRDAAVKVLRPGIGLIIRD
ncbi:MAG: AarF/UbiB family protein, partial [Betaproteobacteria bacterium]